MILPKEQFMDVMIVDDNVGMRKLIRQIVASKFERVVECSSGDECLKQYPKSPTDWVFMDIQMKGLNGIRTTKELKQSFPNANVVIVTRYDDPDLRTAAEEAGACAYVLKENLIDLQKLIEK
ncbi:MAG: response regulator transcription factor [Ignavibacteriales bacterium]|nr:response regulator transcription factor [Ignavibacteriales bacterium]